MKAADRAWQLEPHVCAACLARVVSRPTKEGPREYRCSSCGATGSGQARTVCACGMRVGAKDAGIRCVPNPARTPECPHEIIAKELT